MIGYLLLFVLAAAFIAIGVKGYSANGLPLSRRTSLEGRPGYVVGTASIVIGVAALVLGAYDLIDRPSVPPGQPKTGGLAVRDAPDVSKEPSPDEKPDAVDKKKVEKAKRLAGVGGIYLDVHEAWRNRFATFGWQRLDDMGLLRFEDRAKAEDGLPAFSFLWLPGRFKDLEEPNVPFGLYIQSSQNADAILEEVAEFRRMKALHISLAKSVSQAGLRRLSELPALEWLSLYAT